MIFVWIAQMMAEGVYVIGFSFPVVPKGKARIRTQISAAHSEADIAKVVKAFTTIGKAKGIIG
jgi:glycine C-acetyltransferase